ncbi:hypothetical protein TNCV_698161, partial [Trichonephila clavipes]
DARLPLLRFQRILSSSDVPSLLSRRGHCSLLGDAKGACNSAFNFTVGHPENELTTAKENPKCKQTYKTKLKTVKKEKAIGGRCFPVLHTGVVYLKQVVTAAHSY